MRDYMCTNESVATISESQWTLPLDQAIHPRSSEFPSLLSENTHIRNLPLLLNPPPLSQSDSRFRIRRRNPRRW